MPCRAVGEATGRAPRKLLLRALADVTRYCPMAFSARASWLGAHVAIASRNQEFVAARLESEAVGGAAPAIEAFGCLDNRTDAHRRLRVSAL